LIMDTNTGPARHGPSDPSPVRRSAADKTTAAEPRTGGGVPRGGQVLVFLR
jgi:hypothetical protein